MIQLFPTPYNDFTCPNCGSKDIKHEKIIFQGIHLIADLQCTRCDFIFYHDLPTGHALVYPSAIRKPDLALLYPKDKQWFTDPLISSLHTPSQENIGIVKITKTASPADEVILFNCLDAWYGHVLLKLLNLQFYHAQFPALKKIVLLPKGFEWIVPDYANEIWVTDIKLSETKKYFLKLDQFIHTELSNYRKVYYSYGYSHPPLHHIDTKAFFKTVPFDTKIFNTTAPQITFIYREDRLWLSPFFNKVFNFLNKRGSSFRNIFLKWQIRKINILSKKISKNYPNAKFYVCGIGGIGRFTNSIIDKRSWPITTDKELEWCSIYSNSHVVIGIHGSSMLIPSALGCTWVEILPDDRLGNITQDLFCKYTYDSMPFMGRFVSEYDPIKRVAKTIISIIQDYRPFNEHQIRHYSITE